MINDFLTIFGLESITVSDTALLAAAIILFTYLTDWIFRIIYLVVATLTKRR